MASKVIGHVAGIIYSDGHEWLSAGNGRLTAGGMSQSFGAKGHTTKVYKAQEQAIQERDKLAAIWGADFKPFTREYIHKTY